MRKIFTIALLLTGLTVSADEPPIIKQDNKPPEKKDTVLRVGDPAPALQVARWLQGAVVKEFEPDKIYVIDFWATWCSPCVAIMPQMGALHSEYRDKGVTFIGFAMKDEKGNTSDTVAAFVAKRGPKLGYSFAFADDKKTFDTWITAARRSIPCAFAIGKDGKIVFAGHPMLLPEALPRIVSGKWSNDDAEQFAKIESEAMTVFDALAGSDAGRGLEALGEFQKKYPRLAGIPYFLPPRVACLLKAKKYADAKKAAGEAIDKAVDVEDPVMLTKLSAILRSMDVNNDKELLALSLKSAQAWLKMAGEKDMFALWNVAESYFALGEKAKAREFGAKAVAAGAGESDELKRYLQQKIKRYDEVKKEE